MICFPLPILDPVRFESRFNLSGKEEVVVHRKGRHTCIILRYIISDWQSVVLKGKSSDVFL